MRLRHFKLSVQTTGEKFQSQIKFPDGLVVIRADNSRGKSTCFKSILVALGMEALLTTSQTELPLTPAVTHELMDGDVTHRVTESEVYLEIESSEGKQITVHRALKGDQNSHLVTVYDGPALSTPGNYPAKDYYVSRPGSATKEAGFHVALARFLGWEIPQVSTFEGKECPLYLQTIFPFIFVEQKRGWSTLAPPLPTQFRIREPHRRVVEFLLHLDAYRIALKRQELQAERGRIQSAWVALNERGRDLAATIFGEVQAAPRNPTSQWPPQVLPTIVLPKGETWQPIQTSIVEQKEALRNLITKEIPKVQEIASTAEVELAHQETVLRNREVMLSRLLNTIELEREEADATRQRLAAIREDLIRNKDARTLRDLGSKRLASLNDGMCPVCHQSVHDSLVPLQAQQVVMSLDDNISFLEEQRKTCEAILGDSERVIQARERQVSAIRKIVSELRNTMRILRQTLMSDGRLPSAAAIQARLELERKIQQEEQVVETFGQILDEYEARSKDWKSVESEIASLPATDTTPEDERKLRAWTQLLQEQLKQYGFGSLPVDQIKVSADSYRPEHDGFDLQASISASDLIRTIWAYLLGMMELARTEKTNHPGLLVFDEPRQQSAQNVTFRELLKRAATALVNRQQVIFFTSEDPHLLEEGLSGLQHTLINFDGRLLRPIPQH
ncbi:MAG: hypothetical protein ACKV0T_24430 [Planctomycetales bacterium]